MKKSGNKNSKAGQRRSVFERFTGGDKESPIAGNTPDRQIRHVESPVNLGSSGLTEGFTDTEGYGHAEDMHVWGMNDKKATLRTSKRNVFLGLGIAIGVIILMLAGVFYILPRVLPKLFAGTNIELFVQKQVNYVYTDPKVEAVLQAAPYFDGVQGTGSTVYSIDTSYGESDNTTTSLDWGVGLWCTKAMGPFSGY